MQHYQFMKILFDTTDIDECSEYTDVCGLGRAGRVGTCPGPTCVTATPATATARPASVRVSTPVQVFYLDHQCIQTTCRYSTEPTDGVCRAYHGGTPRWYERGIPHLDFYHGKFEQKLYKTIGRINRKHHLICIWNIVHHLWAPRTHSWLIKPLV